MTVRCFLMVAACLSCLGCRAADPSNSQALASSASSPPAASAPAQAATGKTVVYAYYFHQTFRCQSCQMMEETAARVIQEHFAQQIENGQVVWMPVNIDKPEGKALRQQFQVRVSELVLARMENGVCKKSEKLDVMLGLSDRPDAFLKYLVDQINAYLSPARGRVRARCWHSVAVAGKANIAFLLATAVGMWCIFVWIPSVLKSKGDGTMSKTLKIVVVAGLIVAVTAIVRLKQQDKGGDSPQSSGHTGRGRHARDIGPASLGGPRGRTNAFRAR